MVPFETLLNGNYTVKLKTGSTAQRHNKHDDFIDVMPCYRENYLTTSKVLKIGSTLNIKNASYSLMLHTDLFCSYVADPATFLASNSCSGT